MDDENVRRAHIIDDLATDNGKMRRTIRAQVPMLDDALHALGAGRLEVVAEYLERVRDALNDVG